MPCPCQVAVALFGRTKDYSWLYCPGPRIHPEMWGQGMEWLPVALPVGVLKTMLGQGLGKCERKVWQKSKESLEEREGN